MAQKRSSRPSKKLRTGALVVIGVVAVGLSYAAASTDLAYGAQSMLAAVASTFSTTPTVVITRNPGTPTGILQPTGKQLVGVFDVTPKNFGSFGYVKDISVQLAVGSPELRLGHFALAFGYNKNVSDISSAIVLQKGTQYNISASNLKLNLTAGRVSQLYVYATPYYATPFNAVGATVARVKTSVTSAVATRQNCKTIYYGYQSRYSYVKCVMVSAPENVSQAYTVARPVGRGVGYGYGYFDYDNNNRLIASDVQFILDLVVGKVSCPAFKVCNVDGKYSSANGSGVDVRDAQLLQKYAGTDVSGPQQPVPVISVSPGTASATIVGYSPTTGAGNVGQFALTYKVSAGSRDIFVAAAAGEAPATRITIAKTTSSTVGATGPATVNVTSTSSAAGDVAGSYYKVLANTSRTFTLSAVYTATASGFTGVELRSVGYGTTAALGQVFVLTPGTFRTNDLQLSK